MLRLLEVRVKHLRQRLLLADGGEAHDLARAAQVRHAEPRERRFRQSRVGLRRREFLVAPVEHVPLEVLVHGGGGARGGPRLWEDLVRFPRRLVRLPLLRQSKLLFPALQRFELSVDPRAFRRQLCRHLPRAHRPFAAFGLRGVLAFGLTTASLAALHERERLLPHRLEPVLLQHLDDGQLVAVHHPRVRRGWRVVGGQRAVRRPRVGVAHGVQGFASSVRVGHLLPGLAHGERQLRVELGEIVHRHRPTERGSDGDARVVARGVVVGVVPARQGDVDRTLRDLRDLILEEDDAVARREPVRLLLKLRRGERTAAHRARRRGPSSVLPALLPEAPSRV